MDRQLTTVSYGGGTNSTAMLIGLHEKGIRVDCILFADTGGERPDTYDFIKLFSEWLVMHSMPEIIRVQSQYENGGYYTLEEQCLKSKRLPSIAYGFKSCSEKHKIRPINKFMNHWEPAKKEWASGRKLLRFIGYDMDENHRIRDYDDNKYDVRYPLVEWGWGRKECIAVIKAAGLPLPGKSSCFFCPSMKPSEIFALKEKYPCHAQRALQIEGNAELTTIKGLGRDYAWRELLKQTDIFKDNASVDVACDCYDG